MALVRHSIVSTSGSTEVVGGVAEGHLRVGMGLEQAQRLHVHGVLLLVSIPGSLLHGHDYVAQAGP